MNSAVHSGAADATVNGVELRGVSKAFGPVIALERADLSLPAGKILALVGPSGCGKTTLLRVVAGFEVPDAGDVLVRGRPVAGAGVWVPAEERRVGMVFQQLALFPHLTVAKNIAYGLRKLGRQQREQRVEDLLRLVGLDGYGSRFPDELSGGQAQRVALARALAPEPAVVLLDEPFSSLDVSLRGGVRREVRSILETAGQTALLVTHDQDEALAMGDLLGVMLDGRIVQVGTPHEVYRGPATPRVAEFLGDANLIPGVRRGRVIETEVGDLEMEGPDPEAGDVWALVRPEDLVVDESDGGSAAVTDVEFYGHDQIVVLTLPSGRAVRARLHSRQVVGKGARVGVHASSHPVLAFERREEPDTG